MSYTWNDDMGPLLSLVSFAWFVPVSCVIALLNAPIVCSSFLWFEYYSIGCISRNLLLIPAPLLDIWDAFPGEANANSPDFILPGETAVSGIAGWWGRAMLKFHTDFQCGGSEFHI